MADRRDRSLRTLERVGQRLDGRPGRERLVDEHVNPNDATDLRCGLPGSQKRARENDYRRIGSGGEALAERTRLLSALGRELAEVIRIAGEGMGMSTEIDAHRLARIGATPGSPTRKVVVSFTRYNLIL